MNSNETRTLWISVGAALFAIFLLYSWSQEQKAAMSRQFGSSKRVVVAAKDIAELETIDEAKLEIIERPVDFIEPEAVTDPEAAVGQVAAAPIKKGEQVLQTKLLLPGPETGLSLEITPGKRAITIPIDDMRGVSRLLRPGDRIDLVAAMDFGKGAEQRREVRTILQDVVVLATGLNIANKIPRRLELDSNGKTVTQYNLRGDTTFTNITVEAKPDEVQQLVYILSTSPGSMFATLRHPNDRYINPGKSTTLDDVLGKTTLPPRLPAAVIPPPPPAPVQTKAPPRKRGGFEEL
jgi:pilus assembly protein CpaB